MVIKENYNEFKAFLQRLKYRYIFWMASIRGFSTRQWDKSQEGLMYEENKAVIYCNKLIISSWNWRETIMDKNEGVNMNSNQNILIKQEQLACIYCSKL
jgi:hypothetical protein